MERKELGKIQKVSFGHGGYQGQEIGLWLMLGGQGWGVSTSHSGGWSAAVEITKGTKWTEETRNARFADMVRSISKLLISAKVDDVSKLVGTPIEAAFDGNKLVSWRVLKEVL